MRAQRQYQRIQTQAVPRAGERGERGAGFTQHQDTLVVVDQRAHGGHHGVDRGSAHRGADHETFALFGEIHDLLLAPVQIGQRQFVSGVAEIEGFSTILKRRHGRELAHLVVLQPRQTAYELRARLDVLIRRTFVQVREGGDEQLVIHVHAGDIHGQLAQGLQNGGRIQPARAVGQTGHLPRGQFHVVILAQPAHQGRVQARGSHDLQLEILAVRSQLHGHRSEQHRSDETPLSVHSRVGQPRRRSGRQIRGVQSVHDREFMDLGAQCARRTCRSFVGRVLMMNHRGQPGGTAHQQLCLTRGIGFRQVDAHVVHAVELQQRIRTGIGVHLLGPGTQGHPGIGPGLGGVLGAFLGRVCRHESPTHECADRSTRSWVRGRRTGTDVRSQRVWDYSHSMVPGGLDVTSRTTRLISSTSLVMRLEILASNSEGNRDQSAVIASSLLTGRSTMGWP